MHRSGFPRTHYIGCCIGSGIITRYTNAQRRSTDALIGRDDEVLIFIEDVSRYNAVNAIAKKILLENIKGGKQAIFTTGRLTSEIALKVAKMGLELARKTGVTLISRPGGMHFLDYQGFDTLQLDAESGESLRTG